MTAQELLSSGETCEQLGISKPTLYAMVRDGKLLQYKLGRGRARYYARSEVATLRTELDRVRPAK